MSIQTILFEWTRLYEEVFKCEDDESEYFQNTRYSIDACRDLAGFLIKNKVDIMDWSWEYLETHRKEAWVRWHLSRGYEYLYYLLRGPFSIQDPPEGWDEVVQDISGFKIGFRDAKAVVTGTLARIPLSNCDDPEILLQHAGIPCEYNGWFCWYCDVQECAWRNKLHKQIRENENVFLNKETNEKCLEWCLANLDAITVPEGWTPPTPPHSAEIPQSPRRGQTAAQAMKSVRDRIRRYSNTAWHYAGFYKTDTDFDIFMMIWENLQKPGYDMTFIKDIWRLCEEIDGFY
jgi:hypothetical protein